jgi:hypothetical protein
MYKGIQPRLVIIRPSVHIFMRQHSIITTKHKAKQQSGITAGTRNSCGNKTVCCIVKNIASFYGHD